MRTTRICGTSLVSACAVWATTALAVAGRFDEAPQRERPMSEALRKSVTFYASFDEAVAGDFGGGGLKPSTRFDHPERKGEYVFEEGIDGDVFRIAKGKGVAGGGALECVDVLPRRGRFFFPGQGNIAFRKGGWGGTVSFWLNMDPNTKLKTPFCDPVQITHRGAHDGAIWNDFPDNEPRDTRMGVFPALREGEQPVQESDPGAPLIVMKKVPYEEGEWHHVALVWDNLDTGRPNAEARFYVDGELIGALRDRELAMQWDLDQVGIYTAVSLIGLMDELALFDRPLTKEEVVWLKEHPDALNRIVPRRTGRND